MKILLALSDADVRETLEDTLEDCGCEVVTASDGDLAWAILRAQHAPRLAIVDWDLPKLDGQGICRRLRARENAPYTVVLIPAAGRREKELQRALMAGADDFLLDAEDELELKLRVGASIRLMQVHDDLLRVKAERAAQSPRDMQTGLWNRSALHAILQRELSRARRDEKPVGLLLAELHDPGGALPDEVFREIGDRLQGAVRPYDAVGRQDDLRFLLVLPGCDIDTVGIVGERVLARLVGDPVGTGELSVSLRVSIGGTYALDASEGDIEQLLRFADAALYAARASGSNKMTLCDPAADLAQSG